MSDPPPEKKARICPDPPVRPPEGQPEGEAIAVVAERVSDKDGLEGVRSAFRKRLERINFKVEEKENDLKNFLEKFRPVFIREVEKYYKEQHGLKVYLVLTISYLSQEIPEREPWIFYLGTEAHSINFEKQILEYTELMFKQIETKNDHLVRSKTGLIIDEIHWASIFLSKFNPLSGENFHPLPNF